MNESPFGNLAGTSGASDKRNRTLELMKVEKHTEIFASMCPDEILDFYDDYNTRAYYTTLMLGDVSGFTELTSKYTNSGKGGPSKLTETLNSYIGPMVQEILSHRGDVLKFSGDAFIVMWKSQDGTVMRDLAVEAMQTACIIQKHCGTYETDVGVTLKVKLAIASGKIYFTSIGDPEKISHYIITGQPVWDVKFAEGLCRGGDIIVAPSSWQWANPSEYVFKILPDGIHTLILACNIMWDHTKGRYDESDVEINHDQHSGYLFPRISILQHIGPDTLNPMGNLGSDERLSTYPTDYSLRPKVIQVVKQRIKNPLRSYMLRPIVRSVELDEPLEYLTEIRQVVIVFINVVTENIGQRRLIPLVNTAYKLTCRIISEMQGCVNKTSLFDKDLMFLCIFGLRGDKHEFESQIGLRCAAKLKNELNSIRRIKSVSIGVTTGMTYCGVVGHVLRREYTVIGMAVNKAARLMVAYTDKVVCDRESFLHSRIQAKHFVLQESKYLKGISNVGPVYEFIEFDKAKSDNAEMIVNLYPLLGREIEMKLFKMMLADAKKTLKAVPDEDNGKKSCNILIIRGEPRIGKSRLLDEISSNIPKDIACNYINLIPADREMPFALIHLIFSGPLQFTSSTTCEERERTLLSNLHSIRHPEFLCALNPVFNVEFRVDPRWLSLIHDEKKTILEKLLSKLAQSCFRQLWVIITDDAEYADDESFCSISTIIEINHVFFVFTFGEMEISNRRRQIAKILEKARIIDLMGLDKWFHAGLACQVLNVSAIPAELEKIIQEKSLGNPGWIESYLVSLLQVGGISLKQVPQKSLKEMGLVAPPSIMLEHDKAHDNRANEPIQDRTDGWKMFQASYGENNLRLDHQRSKMSGYTVSSTNENEEFVTVCTMPRTSTLEEVSPEVTIDVLILKLFDSLSPLDQYLLKCAAVLGETVDRNMLEKLMEGTPIHDIAATIVNLLHMRILGCASGDFARAHAPIMFFRNIKSPNLGIEIKCGCTGVIIREALSDLPDYASCLLLRFKIAEFRETTYRLLTEYQKIELHRKALKYLQSNARRCASCGRGPFAKLLGKVYEENPRESKRFLDEFDDILEMDSQISGPIENDQNEEKRMKRRSCLVFSPSMGNVILNTFDDVDFTNCQCDLILINVYTQMLEHCRGIDRRDKTLTAILEFVQVLLATFNVAHATKLLCDAETILKQIYGVDEDDLVTVPFLKAQIKTLQGRCHLQIGLVDEALKCFIEAVEILGYNFPETTPLITLKSRILLAYQRLIFRYWGKYLVSVDEDDAADYNDQLSKCLTQLFLVFRAKGMYDHARLAAIWSLNTALTSNKDFMTLCHAYANMIVVADNYQYQGIITWLESSGIAFCNQRDDVIESQELKAIIELYARISFSRFLRGEMMQASDIGFTALRLARVVKSIGQELMIFPRLIQSLMVEQKIEKILTLMKELELAANSIVDQSGRLWYYAFCVDLQLDCGITIVPFKKCEQFYQREEEPAIHLNDPEAKKRYFTSMWLWCVRMGDWESATIWRQRRININYSINQLTVVTAVTALKNLEGLIIYYVHKIENRNFEIARETHLEIVRQLKITSKINKFVKVCVLRYTILRSYYYMVHGQRSKALKQFDKFRKYASGMDNKLISAWANHCKKAWSTNKLDTLWHETCLKNENTEVIVHYALPLPKSLRGSLSQ